MDMALDPALAFREAPWLISPKARTVIVELFVTSPVIDTLAGDEAASAPTPIVLVVPAEASIPANVKAVVALAGKEKEIEVAMMMPEVRVNVAVPPILSMSG